MNTTDIKRRELIGGPLDGEFRYIPEGSFEFNWLGKISPTVGTVRIITHVYELCIDGKYRYQSWEP